MINPVPNDGEGVDFTFALPSLSHHFPPFPLSVRSSFPPSLPPTAGCKFFRILFPPRCIKQVPVPVEKIIYKDVEVPIEKVVQVPVHEVKVVEVIKEVPIENVKIVEIEKIVEKPVVKEVERFIEKIVEVPKEVIVEKYIEKEVPVYVDKVVTKEEIVYVDRVVEKPVFVDPIEKTVTVETVSYTHLTLPTN